MTDGLGSKVLKGAAWTIAGRFSLRLVGLVNTAILARLLTPADFGLVAMGMIVIGLVEGVFDLGVRPALLRRADTTDADFDTAWTVTLIQGAVMALLVAAVAPFATLYFGDSRVELMLWILACVPFLRGMQNIGVLAFEKALDFHKTFRLELVQRLLLFAVTVAAAVILENYWALVVGQVAGAGLSVLVSYVMHPFRPRLGTQGFAELWSVSKWIMLGRIGAELFGRADRIVLANRVSAEGLGHYTMGSELASLPATALVGPIQRVLLPAMAMVSGSPERLSAGYHRAIGLQTLVALPVCVGIAMVARSLVAVLLGAQWSASTTIVQILVIATLSQSFRVIGYSALLVLGRQRQLAWVSWTNLAVFLVLVIVVFPNADGVRMAIILATLSWIGFVIQTTYLSIVGIAAPRSLLAVVWRPVVGSVAMALGLAVLPIQGIGLVWVQFVVEIATGAAIYALTVLALWRIFGGNAGAEAELIERVPAFRRLIGGSFDHR
ncbi:MAG: lipopolysaccharide biosynthesis protein [Alphaproteobacteria bacterium]